MKERIKNNGLILLLFIFLSIIFILPQLFTNHPTLIDDGSDLFFVRDKSFLEVFSNELFYSPRTWPLRLVYRKGLFELFNLQIEYHFFVQAMILALIVFFTYLLYKKMKISSIFALLGSLFIFLMPATVGNVYRLGTVEHLQILLFLLGFLFLGKNKWISLFLFSINCLIKETSLFFLIIPFLYEIFTERKGSFLVFNSLAIIGYLLTILWKFLLFNNQYIHLVGFELSNIKNIIFISPISLMALICSLIFLFLMYRKGKRIKKLHILLIVALLMSIFSALIWKMVFDYYYLPSQIISLLILAVFFNFLIDKQKEGKLFLSIIIALTSVIMGYHFRRSYFLAKNMHRRHLTEGALANFILENDWSGYEIYSAVDEYEKNHKIHLYFMLWNPQRSATKFIPNMEEWLFADFLDYGYFTHLAHEATMSFREGSRNNKILISKTPLDLVDESSYERLNICGESPFLGTECEYFVLY